MKNKKAPLRKPEKCFGLLFDFICSHSACRRCPTPLTVHLRRPRGIRSAPAGRTRQQGNLYGQTGRTDYHQLHLPHIDHICVLVEYGIVMRFIEIHRLGTLQKFKIAAIFNKIIICCIYNTLICFLCCLLYS